MEKYFDRGGFFDHVTANRSSGVATIDAVEYE
jgi:hypothetical protein